MRQVFRSKFRVSQEFGVNKEYYSKFGLQGHEGIDLIPTGSIWDILCLEDGIVVKDEDNKRSGAYGNNLTIWSPTIRKAIQYCHLEENYISFGDKVKMGDKIGLMGATGNVTGAHLHLNLFEVDNNGHRLNKNNGFLGGIDPLPFLNEDSQPQDTTALDECNRKLADEIKKKEENWKWGKELENDLEGTKAQIITYENNLKAIASTLKVEPAMPKIMGEITKFVGVEDQLTECQRNLKDSKSNEATLTQNLSQKEQGLSLAVKQVGSLSSEIQKLTKEMEFSNGQIEILKKAVKYIPVFWLFGYVICKEKEGGEK